jgi:hypothetical protein
MPETVGKFEEFLSYVPIPDIDGKIVLDPFLELLDLLRQYPQGDPIFEFAPFVDLAFERLDFELQLVLFLLSFRSVPVETFDLGLEFPNLLAAPLVDLGILAEDAVLGPLGFHQRIVVALGPFERHDTPSRKDRSGAGYSLLRLQDLERRFRRGLFLQHPAKGLVLLMGRTEERTLDRFLAAARTLRVLTATAAPFIQFEAFVTDGTEMAFRVREAEEVAWIVLRDQVRTAHLPVRSVLEIETLERFLVLPIGRELEVWIRAPET